MEDTEEDKEYTEEEPDVLYLTQDGTSPTEEDVQQSNLPDIEKYLEDSAIYVPPYVIKKEDVYAKRRKLEQETNAEQKEGQQGDNSQQEGHANEDNEEDITKKNNDNTELSDSETAASKAVNQPGESTQEQQNSHDATTTTEQKDGDKTEEAESAQEVDHDLEADDDIDVVIGGSSTQTIWQRNRFQYNKNEAVPIATRGEDGDIEVMMGSANEEESEQNAHKESQPEILSLHQQNAQIGPNIRRVDERAEKRGPSRKSDGTWVSSIGIELPKNPILPPDEKKVIFDHDPEDLEDQSWSKPGADISEWFNFGLNAQTWRMYCRQQRLLRKQMRIAQQLDQQQQHQNRAPQ